MKVRIKVCGVCSLSDVEACVQAGVDMVGFNFWPGSKRYIPPAKAAELVRALPATVSVVAVFVRETPARLAEACKTAGISMAQLHGDEDPRTYQHAGVNLLQVIRVPPGASADSLPRPHTRPVLLDAKVPAFGGQGTAFDWQVAQQAQRLWDVPVVLAGGLTPDNVAAAIRAVRPYGVDVASGVEQSPGVKDARRLKEFVAAVRMAEA